MRCARASFFILLIGGAIWVLAGPVAAQQLGLPKSAILTINTDRLFAESAFGQRIAVEIEAESAVLAAENRRIEGELSREEQNLTEKRSQMAAEAFRALADEFDAKVQKTRLAQDTKARELAQKREARRVEFLQAVRPVLAELMREAGAGVILERSNVFISANAIDVTDIAVTRIDAIMGDGATAQGDPPPAPEE